MKSIIALIVVAFIVYKIFKLIQDRNLISNYDRIQEYLIKNNLKLIKIINPSSKDWKKSPFKKPPTVEISLIQIRVLGMPIDASDVEYQIIEVINPANKTFRIWMKIDTSIMTKTKIQYQKEID